MRGEVARDLTASAAVFEQYIRPELLRGSILGEYRFYDVQSVEGDKTDMIKNAIDGVAGIDYFGMDSRRGVVGIASRNQIDMGFRTFTARIFRGDGSHDVELMKTLRHIQSGALCPQITLQSYMPKDDRGLITLGITKTRLLYEWIEQNLWHNFFTSDNWRGFASAIKNSCGACLGKMRIRKVGNSPEWFAAVDWQTLERDGVHVEIRRIVLDPLPF